MIDVLNAFGLFARVQPRCRRLKSKYRPQRRLLAALPVSARIENPFSGSSRFARSSKPEIEPRAAQRDPSGPSGSFAAGGIIQMGEGTKTAEHR
ncbi:MAG: hypothetical protein WAU39_18260 [Polyangiales bacterium]